MSAAILKPRDLLKCSDGDFDRGIQDLGLKELLETISLIQKEQSREQENFNSLKNDLDSLKKNSSQYKHIQKEMKASQMKMSTLMNKSMKCFQQQGNLHISKPAADIDEKRNSKDLEKNAKAQTNIIPPSKSGTENKTTRTENQSKQPTTATNATSVVKGTGGQQNGSVPQDVEKSTKTSQITVSFSGKPSVPQVRMNGESGKNALSSGGEKQLEKGESINGKSETVQSYKTSVSVKPPSMQNNTVNKETSDKNVENSNPSKPAVVKADPKLVKSTAPAVVYHMGRPVSVDQNLGQSRDQMLEEIRNFKRKSDPISDVKKPEAKEVFSTTTGTMLESSNDKLKKGSTVSSSEEEVDSGSGSAESSPKREKFVSSFSFPQKSQNSITSVSHGDQGEKGKTTPAAPSKTGNVEGRP